MFPVKISLLTLKPVQEYPQLMREMCEDVARNSAIVVFFNRSQWQMPTAEELTACGLAVTHRTADGLVFARVE